MSEHWHSIKDTIVRDDLRSLLHKLGIQAVDPFSRYRRHAKGWKELKSEFE